MNELIPLHSQTIDGNAVETVSARELHTFLEVGRDFSTWIKDRIERYEFVENQDFVKLPKTGELENKGLQGKTKTLFASPKRGSLKIKACRVKLSTLLP